MALGIDTARAIAGALLIDKPSGPTSHDVVAFARRALKIDRAGHTGTLDPLATGLMVVLVGGATRLAQFLGADEKEYIADVRLGVATPTYDAASLSNVGDQRSEVGRPEVRVDLRDIEAALARFRGTFLQTPPPYSAKKIASVPAYEKARKNQTVELKPVEVTVRELEIVHAGEPRTPAAPTSLVQPPTSDLGHAPLRLRVTASAGFYVRSLAHDIGQVLGCGAHLEALRRVRVGRFRVEDALTLDRVEGEGRERLISAGELVGHMPAVTITDHDARRVAHGNPVLVRWSGEMRGSSHVRLLGEGGELLAMAEPRPGGVLQPVVVLR